MNVNVYFGCNANEKRTYPAGREIVIEDMVNWFLGELRW